MVDINKLEGYYQQALKYAKIGEYTIALDMIAKMHEILPNNDKIYLTSAAIKMTAEDYDGCIQDSWKCVNLNPENASGWNHLGVALCSSGDVSSGLGAFQKAMDLGLEDASVNFNHWLSK
jgi:tetratricopeptide (TPR) repeat protein